MTSVVSQCGEVEKVAVNTQEHHVRERCLAINHMEDCILCMIKYDALVSRLQRKSCGRGPNIPRFHIMTDSESPPRTKDIVVLTHRLLERLCDLTEPFSSICISSTRFLFTPIQ